MVGKSLSHYKIEAELGRGGMGIGYRAEDTKLDRTVAIKVLPSAALASEDDIQWPTNEIQLYQSVPYICNDDINGTLTLH